MFIVRNNCFFGFCAKLNDEHGSAFSHFPHMHNISSEQIGVFLAPPTIPLVVSTLLKTNNLTE